VFRATKAKPGQGVLMPDGQPYIVKRLLSAANHKQEKGEGYRSLVLTLTPRATDRSGRNLCPFATKGCASSCFAGYDRLAWSKNKRAALARTLLLARNPAAFISILKADIAHAADSRSPLVVRLNVVSDVAWEREHPTLFGDFPRVQFMDYTKDASRLLDPKSAAELPSDVLAQREQRGGLSSSLGGRS
jgi:hypothetical protein